MTTPANPPLTAAECADRLRHSLNATLGLPLPAALDPRAMDKWHELLDAAASHLDRLAAVERDALTAQSWPGSITRAGTGGPSYGIRRCRDHFHVTCEGTDLASSIPFDDPFIEAKYDDINAALDVADKLNGSRATPSGDRPHG